MLLAIALTLAAHAAPDYSPLFDHEPETDMAEADAHLPQERTLSTGDVVTVWSDGATVAVLAAVGEDGLMGADFVDEHDPNYALVLHVFDVDQPAQRQSQVLFEGTGLAALPTVQWAGDLDGDQMPDLIISADGASRMYLSGQATGDALVASPVGG